MRELLRAALENFRGLDRIEKLSEQVAHLIGFLDGDAVGGGGPFLKAGTGDGGGEIATATRQGNPVLLRTKNQRGNGGQFTEARRGVVTTQRAHLTQEDGRL